MTILPGMQDNTNIAQGIIVEQEALKLGPAQHLTSEKPYAPQLFAVETNPLDEQTLQLCPKQLPFECVKEKINSRQRPVYPSILVCLGVAKSKVTGPRVLAALKDSYFNNKETEKANVTMQFLLWSRNRNLSKPAVQEINDMLKNHAEGNNGPKPGVHR